MSAGGALRRCGHGATPFGGNETASIATVAIAGTDFLELAARLLPFAIAFLTHICLEGQRPSDGVEFL